MSLTDRCKECRTELVCMGGRSAHPSNWYCPVCELRVELAALRAERDSLRYALMEVRIRLHAAGRRPEECYEMSVIDDALRAALGESDEM